MVLRSLEMVWWMLGHPPTNLNARSLLGNGPLELGYGLVRDISQPFIQFDNGPSEIGDGMVGARASSIKFATQQSCLGARPSLVGAISQPFIQLGNGPSELDDGIVGSRASSKKADYSAIHSWCSAISSRGYLIALYPIR
ncbi:hypothetical protein U1Q18_008174 [Sarracenia purpurea var. burkii]